MRWILGLCICVMLAISLACEKTVSYYAVSSDLTVENYLPDKGTVEWTGLGARFQVQFFDPSPCDMAKSQLSAANGGVATCVVGKNMDGNYAYVLNPPGQGGTKPTLLAPGGAGPFPMRVGACGGCMEDQSHPVGKTKRILAAPGTGPVAAKISPDGTPYVVSCSTGTATVSSPTINAPNGSSFEWYAIGQGTPTVAINFTGASGSPCGTNLGPSGRVSCFVAGTSGTTYTYTVTHSQKGCNQGTGYSVYVP